MARLFCALLISLLAGCTRPPEGKPEPAPELVLRGGTVHTDLVQGLQAEALATRDGRVVFVGNEDDLDRWLAGRIPELTLDLARRYLLPGFIDAHAHPLAPALLYSDGLSLARFSTEKQVSDAIAAFHRENPSAPWLIGHGWQLTLYGPDGPTAAALDRLVGDRPAILYGADNYSAWVSTAALAAAKITKDFADPPDGKVERLSSGEPSGTLRGAIVERVEASVPALSIEKRTRALLRSLGELSRAGVTSFQTTVTSADVEVFASLARQGALTARPRLAARVRPLGDSNGASSVVERLRGMAGTARAAGLTLETASLRLDGGLETATAALAEPYTNRPKESGKLYWKRDDLHAVAAAIDKAGFDLLVHAAGDLAIEEALTLRAHLTETNGPRERRYCITGAQVVPPQAVERMAALGVCLIIQPQWAQADAYMARLVQPAVGEARRAWLYPLGDVANAGVRLAMGSEWPASDLAPLAGVEVAVRGVPHRSPKGAIEPLNPQQLLDLPEALAAYTEGSAYALRMERVAAKLIVGRYADAVAFPAPPRAVQPTEIGELPVDLTFLGGGLVFKYTPPS